MNVLLLGSGPHAAARRQAIAACPGAVLLAHVTAFPHPAEQDPVAALPDDLFARADVAFLTVPPAGHGGIAEAAAKHGVHLFLEWPPTSSIAEGEALVQLAEEAGVEIGVSRPLRVHPALQALPADARIDLIVYRHEVDSGVPASWLPHAAEALDLCCALAQSHSIQRIDAEAVPHQAAWPEAMALALRFHRGTYAQASLYRTDAPAGRRLYLAGHTFQRELALDPLPADAPPERQPLVREARRFLDALTQGTPAPVSALDALHTMRLLERLMAQLR